MAKDKKSSSSSSSSIKGKKKIGYDINDDNDSISNEIESIIPKKKKQKFTGTIDDSDNSYTEDDDDEMIIESATSQIKRLNNKIIKGENAGNIFFELLKNIKDNKVTSEQLSMLMTKVPEERYKEELVPFINEKVAGSQITLYKDREQGDVTAYKLIKQEEANKLAGLSSEQRLVYDVCDRASNKGIWTRDIKLATNIPQHNLTKILKVLEVKNLIKSVRSIASKSKKLYMLFDQMPTKEITGGPWYTDQEFDQKFTEELGKFIVKAVGSRGRANINDISEIVKNSGVFKVELREEDIALMLNTLVYDGDLDEIGKHYSSTKYYQKVKNNNNDDNNNRIIKQEVPCLNCPVISQCTEGGLVSPTTCEYLQKWLKTDF